MVAASPVIASTFSRYIGGDEAGCSLSIFDDGARKCRLPAACNQCFDRLAFIHGQNFESPRGQAIQYRYNHGAEAISETSG